jgi:hypothetical protein
MQKEAAESGDFGYASARSQTDRGGFGQQRRGWRIFSRSGYTFSRH